MVPLAASLRRLSRRRAARPAAAVALALALTTACHGGGQKAQPGPAASASETAATTTAPTLPPASPRKGSRAGSEGCPGGDPKTPVEYGVCHVELAKARAKSSAKVAVVLASDAAARGVEVGAVAESYAIVPKGDETLVVGRDGAGAMYGALEVAERLDMQGASALPVASPVRASPALAIRGANLVLVCPEHGHPWFFREVSFWTEYLDMMARGRLNFLDIHGMYDLADTSFLNPLFYFASSASVPQLGLPKAEREQNLAMLNTVIRMAEGRGIKVGLMSYRATVDRDDPEEKRRKETKEEKDEGPTYTREAVVDLLTRAPGLDYVGFRIGESAKGADWYSETYMAALKQTHSKAHAITRTWKTTKKGLAKILEEGGPETIVEAKYNGEQLGNPYVISGGNMERWGSYSYEDFLTPPAPYRFVFQIRNGGTNRIFRYASYERTRRAVLSMMMSPRVAGFSFEAAHAYMPQYDFYHASPADSFSPYAFRRDELSYMLFGRLAYDPNTPEAVFRAMLAERVGTDALWGPVQAASDIVPTHLEAHTCGPDQRSYAPELELGGPVGYWAGPLHVKGPKGSCTHPMGEGHSGVSQQAFDEFAMAVPYEAAAALLAGKGLSRLSPVDIALLVLADAKEARKAKEAPVDPGNAEGRDVVRECLALADLGDWLGHKLRGATALAVYEGSGSDAWLEAAREETKEADAAYVALAKATSYIKPFEERMRMRMIDLTSFHWEKNVPRLAEDAQSIDAVVEKVKEQKPHASARLPDPKEWLNTPRKKGPGLASLKITPDDPDAASWVVTATFGAAVPPGATVRVLHRRFSSDGPDWAAVEATGSGATWKATLPGTKAGGMFAVEIDGGPGAAWRYPDVLTEAPYKALAP